MPIENFILAWKMGKSKIEKHHGMTNSIAQTVMFLEMQICFFPGLNEILNGTDLFFQSSFFSQKRHSKFSINHIFHRILMKFGFDAHLYVFRQSHKTVSCRPSAFGNF